MMALSRAEVRRALFVLVLVWILATGPRELAGLGAALSAPRLRAPRSPARARPLRAARRTAPMSAAGIMRARRR